MESGQGHQLVAKVLQVAADTDAIISTPGKITFFCCACSPSPELAWYLTDSEQETIRHSEPANRPQRFNEQPQDPSMAIGLTLIH